VILLHESQAGRCRVSPPSPCMNPIRKPAFQRGGFRDTIIRPAYWGSPELPRSWVHTVLKNRPHAPAGVLAADLLGLQDLSLPEHFYREFYPRRPAHPAGGPVPDGPSRQALRHDYRPELASSASRTGHPLREGVARSPASGCGTRTWPSSWRPIRATARRRARLPPRPSG
jgi:hypothetical protein